MLFKILVTLLTIGANALPEAVPQAGRQTTTLTKTRTVTSTIPARTVTRTITTCTVPPRTVTRTTTSTIRSPASTLTRTVTLTSTKTITSTSTKPASTITKPASTITKTVTFTPTPTSTPPPAYLELIIHGDTLCGTSPVKGNQQNPNDDQITVPVIDGVSECRDTKRNVGSFSWTRLNRASFGRYCRIYYYSEQTCQGSISDLSLENENKCINVGSKNMQSFEVKCN